MNHRFTFFLLLVLALACTDRPRQTAPAAPHSIFAIADSLRTCGAAEPRVADRSAADFMKEFYQEVHAGRAPAEALLNVRRRWISAGGDAAHPSHWAPFILVGAVRDR